MSCVYLPEPFALYACFLALLLGAVMGSFLHCAAWRMVRGESFLKGRSRCPVCGHTLAPPDLIPLAGWLALRGHCRYCGAPVPVRYVLTEGIFAAVSLLCLLRFGLSALCLRNYVFLCCLFCLSLVDLECFVIPTECLFLSVCAWLAALPWMGYTRREIGLYVLAALLCSGGIHVVSLVTDRLLKKESLGGGDIRLFAVTGLYLGPLASLFGLFLSCVLGLLFALATRRGRGEAFPFGPAISTAAALMLFCGDTLTAWYLGLLGL